MSKYIGSRIVPKHCGYWNSTNAYDVLSLVLYPETGDSYIARKNVPVGTDLFNTDYWALAADYSAQLAAVREKVSDLQAAADILSAQIASMVAASTDADADYAAEVVDARAGADGQTYDSLGEAIRQQVGNLDDMLSGALAVLRNDLSASSSGYVDISEELLEVTEGYYYNSNGNLSAGDSYNALLYYSWHGDTVKVGSGIQRALIYSSTNTSADTLVEVVFTDNTCQTEMEIELEPGQALGLNYQRGSFSSYVLQILSTDAYTLKHLVLDQYDNTELDGRVTVLEGTAENHEGQISDIESLLDTGFYLKKLSELTVTETHEGYYANGSGKLSASSSYITYAITFDRDVKVYSAWDGSNYGRYFSLAYGGVLYREYNDYDETLLPTEDSPLEVAAGETLLVTVFASVADFDLYVTGAVLSDLTVEDVAARIGLPELQAELAQTQERLSTLEESVASLTDANKFLYKCYTEGSEYDAEYDGYYGNGNGQLSALDSYYTYDLLMEKAGYVYGDVAAVSSATTYYLSICILSADGSSGTRYRHYSSDDDVPTADEPLYVEAGATVRITVQKGTQRFFVYVQDSEAVFLSNSLHLNDTQKEEIQEIAEEAAEEKSAELEDQVSYNDPRFQVVCSGDDDTVYFFMPTETDLWLRYTFQHYTSESKNADGWVMYVVHAGTYVGGVFTASYPVVVAGEWEMAVKIDGRPDFIGCRNHGSEITTSIRFFADGTEFTPTDGLTMKVRELAIVEISDMYDPDDEVTVVGTHYKDYRITKQDGITVRQRIDWILDETMNSASYVCMFPVCRGNDSQSDIQVTDTAYCDYDYLDYDVSTTSHSMSAHRHGLSFYRLRGSETGVSAEASWEIEDEQDGSWSMISNSTAYNKVYVAYCGTGYEVKAGDSWKWKSRYRINIR